MCLIETRAEYTDEIISRPNGTLKGHFTVLPIPGPTKGRGARVQVFLFQKKLLNSHGAKDTRSRSLCWSSKKYYCFIINNHCSVVS